MRGLMRCLDMSKRTARTNRIPMTVRTIRPLSHNCASPAMKMIGSASPTKSMKKGRGIPKSGASDAMKLRPTLKGQVTTLKNCLVIVRPLFSSASLLKRSLKVSINPILNGSLIFPIQSFYMLLNLLRSSLDKWEGVEQHRSFSSKIKLKWRLYERPLGSRQLDFLGHRLDINMQLLS